jgi:hypothetical protein
MPQICRCFRRLLAALILVSVLPATASAQETGSLKTPTIAAMAAAAADWATTYHALKNYHVREMNPIMRPFEESPGSLVTVGSLIDVGMVSGWNLTMGRRNPRVAAAGLWAMTAFRAYLAVHNIRNEQKAQRR